MTLIEARGHAALANKEIFLMGPLRPKTLRKDQAAHSFAGMSLQALKAAIA
jgi:hypothetical protein